MFKKRKGVHIPYNKQGLVYFTCMNLSEMPEDVRCKVSDLCREVAGEHHEALYAMLTDDTKNVHGIAMEYHLSETQLYHYRKKFYEAW